MQRDRISKYSWSVRGFLPGRQRLRCSLANDHSQGARWLMLSSGHNLYHAAALRRLTLRLSRAGTGLAGAARPVTGRTVSFNRLLGGSPRTTARETITIPSARIQQ